jgi:mRNA interferase RelE/StbE
MGALYGFAYSEKALAFLATIPVKFRRQITKKIGTLASVPIPPTSKQLHCVKDEDEPVHRIRSGDYRVLYVIRSNPDQVIVLDIDHRKDIYR